MAVTLLMIVVAKLKRCVSLLPSQPIHRALRSWLCNLSDFPLAKKPFQKTSSNPILPISLSLSIAISITLNIYIFIYLFNSMKFTKALYTIRSYDPTLNSTYE
jgi:hypothetical protein